MLLMFDKAGITGNDVLSAHLEHLVTDRAAYASVAMSPIQTSCRMLSLQHSSMLRAA
jgi:hypothetical protein